MKNQDLGGMGFLMSFMPKEVKQALDKMSILLQFLPEMETFPTQFAFDGKNPVDAIAILLGIEPTAKNIDTIRNLVVLIQPTAQIVPSGTPEKPCIAIILQPKGQVQPTDPQLSGMKALEGEKKQ